MQDISIYLGNFNLAVFRNWASEQVDGEYLLLQYLHECNKSMRLLDYSDMLSVHRRVKGFRRQRAHAVWLLLCEIKF